MQSPKLAIALGLAAVLVFACSSSTTGTGAPACGGFTSTDKACNTCLTTSCCSEGSTCNGNAECNAIYACVQACSTETCAENCITSHPNGVNDFNAFTTCVTNDCNTACGGNSTGGDAAVTCGGFQWKTATCQTCFDSACCTQGTKCGGNAECLALDKCNANCGQDTTCIDNCNAAHPNGVADLNAVGACLTGPCGTACGLSSPDAGQQQCGGFTSKNACDNTCLQSTCCSQASACAADTQCVNIFNCVINCAPNDNTCIQACGNGNQAGIPHYNAFSNCIGACPCGTDGGGPG